MIYLVEDDSSIRELVVYTLNNSSLEAVGFEKPSDFFASLNPDNAQAVILDIMLPEYDGLQVLQKIRSSEKTKDIPVMMLTAKSTEYDKVIGLDSGADDYMTKPFGMMELVSRVKALIRRSGKGEKNDSKTYSVGSLSVCPEKYTASSDGREQTLTRKEFELLCLLIENPGQVFTRDAILNKIWGYDFDGESRTVDMHIKTLRQKLGSNGEMIETVRGIGYKIGEKENDR